MQLALSYIRIKRNIIVEGLGVDVNAGALVEGLTFFGNVLVIQSQNTAVKATVAEGPAALSNAHSYDAVGVHGTVYAGGVLVRTCRLGKIAAVHYEEVFPQVPHFLRSLQQVSDLLLRRHFMEAAADRQTEVVQHHRILLDLDSLQSKIVDLSVL